MITTDFDRADEFLNHYRALEEALNVKYGFEEKVFGSAIVRFINDKESKPYREKLNICREIRNLLSHHSEVNGERIVEPALSMIEFLAEVTAYVSRPPLALDSATHYDDILKTSLSQKAQTVMRKMERLGFSHVPVIESGDFLGVFSVSTVFSYSLLNGMTAVSDDMTIGDFRDFIGFDKHSTEKFLIVGKDTTIFEVRQQFDKRRRTKRLAAVFITDNGSSEGRILGMLTPWDVINN